MWPFFYGPSAGARAECALTSKNNTCWIRARTFLAERGERVIIIHLELSSRCHQLGDFDPAGDGGSRLTTPVGILLTNKTWPVTFLSEVPYAILSHRFYARAPFAF